MHTNMYSFTYMCAQMYIYIHLEPAVLYTVVLVIRHVNISLGSPKGDEGHKH